MYVGVTKAVMVYRLEDCEKHVEIDDVKKKTVTTKYELACSDLLLNYTWMVLEEFLQLISLLLESLDFFLKCLICLQIVVIFNSNVLDLFSTLHTALFSC